MNAPKNRAQAKAQGFFVDDTCYPWVAYKGHRFAPTEIHDIQTDREWLLEGVVFAADELLEYMDSPIRMLRLAQAVQEVRGDDHLSWSAKVYGLFDHCPQRWPVWEQLERLQKRLRERKP